MNAAEMTPLLFIAASFLYLPLLAFIIRRRDSRLANVDVLFVLVLISFGMSLILTLLNVGWLGTLDEALLARLFLYGILVLAWLFFRLTRSFLQMEGVEWVSLALGLLIFALALALDLKLLRLGKGVTLLQGWQLGQEGLAFGILLVGWGWLMGRATYLMARVYRRTRRPLHRNRIKYWSLALVFGIAGAGLFIAGHHEVSCAFYLAGAFLTVLSMLTYRLPDMRRIGRQFLSYLIATLVAGMAYSGGLLLASRWVQPWSAYLSLRVGMVLALLLALIYGLLLRLARRLVNRLTLGQSVDPGRTVRDISARISNILDLEELGTAVVGLISKAMDVQNGALFAVSYHQGQGEEEDSFFFLDMVGGLGEELVHGRLSENNPVAQALRKESRPLLQYEIDLLPRFQSLSPEERAWLAGLDMDVYVPVHAQNEWIGLLVMGHKASRDRFYEDDLVLLSTLADQTAVALENAHLYESLKRQNAENRALNTRLSAANLELSRLGQAKSDFIDIASHELRTPLTQVRGYNDMLGEMLQDGSITPEMGARMTGSIRRAACQLEQIVNTMLDASKIDTETLELVIAPTSLVLVCRAAEKRWAQALEERKQILTVLDLEDLPVIEADAERLEQVFVCLLQNAIKYTPDGGHIQIRGRLLDPELPPEKQTVELVVADKGIGIERDELERIFEKFYRVGDVLLHSTGDTKFKGAGPGLGLTIARGIVEAHGGHIWAESQGLDEEACPGAEFHFLLPVKPRRIDLERLESVRAARGWSRAH